MKAAIFHPRARQDIGAFPEEVKRELGKAIFDLQKGNSLGMPLSRPIPGVALEVDELRVMGCLWDLSDSLLQEVEAGDFDPSCFRKKDAENTFAGNGCR